MTPPLDFYIDCLGSLGLWKFVKRTRTTMRQYKITQTEMYNARQFSMDACIIYENSILRVYDDYITDLKPKDWVIDVGSHIGTFSIHLLRRFPNLRIVGLEPHPQTYRLLTMNIADNNLKSAIETLQMGVAKTHGTGRLYTDIGNTGEYSLSGSGLSLPIKLTTLHSVFSKYNITHCALLKLDCEGAEYEILTSTPSSLLQKVDTIIMETHPLYDEDALKKFLSLQGFSVKTIPNAITHPVIGQFLTVPLCIATR